MVFHDTVFGLVLAVAWFVAFFAWGALISERQLGNRSLRDLWPAELSWTLVPMLAIWGVGKSSLRLLYALEDRRGSAYAVRVIARQWFWQHERANQEIAARAEEALGIRAKQLDAGRKRLGATDRPLCVPVGVRARLILTSADVLHSFSLPAVGLKLDAVPGRINTSTFFLHRAGAYYGRCSELCGANHSFMPIVVLSLPHEFFREGPRTRVRGWRIDYRSIDRELAD